MFTEAMMVLRLVNNAGRDLIGSNPGALVQQISFGCTTGLFCYIGKEHTPNKLLQGEQMTLNTVHIPMLDQSTIVHTIVSSKLKSLTYDSAYPGYRMRDLNNTWWQPSQQFGKPRPFFF